MNRETATVLFCAAVLAAIMLWKGPYYFKTAPVVTPDDTDGDTSPIVVSGPSPIRAISNMAAPYNVLPPAIFYDKSRVAS